jgi:hypothetical protein
MKPSSSQVKSVIRRGLRQLLDPDPKPADRLRVWKFFDSQCAYCGTKLELGKGDLDHLISAAKDGSNHISNRVLSCKTCNAEEKREMAWNDFLKKKCSDEQTLAERQRKIEEWMSQCGGSPLLSEEILRLLESEYKRVAAEYDAACRKIRTARDSRL